jgi:hypothetical protein
MRSVLVIAEVALALVLLIGAGLTIRSFSRPMAIDLGFDRSHVVTMRLNLPNARYPDLERWKAFHLELMRRTVTMPAVEAVALNSAVPLEGSGSESAVRYEGQPPPRSIRDDTASCLFQPRHLRRAVVHRDVMRLIIGHGMALTVAGLAIGLAASWAITRWLSALLDGVSPHDPVTFAAIAVLLATTAFVASYLPGRRATRVDPVLTLRYE